NLLPYAEKMLDLASEARAIVAGGEVPTGTLKITAPETVCTYRFPTLLRQFRQRFPQVKLLFRPYPLADIRRGVNEGDIDVAFVLEEPLHSTSLVIENLVPEPLYLLAAPDYPLANLPILHTSDLEGEPFLLTEAGCSYRHTLERALNEAGVHASTNLDFISVEAIKQCAIAAMGITFLPAITVRQELEEGRLVILNWEQRSFGVITQMLWHKDKWLSPALQAFLGVAREVLKP
ncbi:MAG TPA: substrate-binding domain-containing protein, partial [Ktedonobacteraceae bacterium]|nr:substrate-binding domain-containing protein [Ktedonobacteraceae bacterium]